MVLLVLALAGMAVPARADWPAPRANAQRTAACTGTSNIAQPSSYWRFFAGGSIGSAQALALDVDGDGVPEAVLASGDGVSAKRPDTGDTVWHNGDAPFGQLDGTADVDGDGTAELLVHTKSRLFVLRLTDGKTLWSEPEGEMGFLAEVRVADLDGDGIDDVVIEECGCCIPNSGKSLVVYSFAGGFGAAKLLWSPPGQTCGAFRSSTVVHMRGPKVTDLIYGQLDRLQLLDGKTGSVVAEMVPFGKLVQASQCQPVDLSGDQIDELLCVLNDTSGLPNNGRRAYLVRYAVDPEPRLEVVWQQLVGDTDGDVSVPPSPLADLDGDGKLELALTGKRNGSWATFVYDVATGAPRAEIDGEQAAGIAPLQKGNALLTTVGTTLSGWQLAPNKRLWSRAEVFPYAFTDMSAGHTSHLSQRSLWYAGDGDRVPELVAGSGPDVTSSVVLVHGGDGTSSGPSYAAPAGVTLPLAWSFPVGPKGAPRLAVAQSDGNFHLLDAAFQPASGNKSFGARFAGFYASGAFRGLFGTPSIAKLGAGVDGLIASTSSGALVRLDASQASLAVAPRAVWIKQNMTGGQVVAGIINGGPGVVAIARLPGSDDRLVLLDPDGNTVWQAAVTGSVLTDPVIGNFDGDGVPDVAIERGSDLGETVSAFSGRTGAKLWDSQFFGPEPQPAGGAVADWNGDGIDDYLIQFKATIALDGKTGQVLAQSPAGAAYFMPILRDVDGDGSLEATLYGGYGAPGTLAHDLQSFEWQGDPNIQPFVYGAMASCPGSPPILLGGSWAVEPELDRFATAGPKAGLVQSEILAGGGVFDTLADAQAAGAKMGQLAAPSVHDNLGGDGAPIAVLGSADGWLYGIEACTGKLRFSQQLGAPVGAVGFGDVDGDGNDEIIVSVADGYLYALEQAPLPAPQWVHDTDPPHGILERQISDIDTADTLYGAWPTVVGADGYEIAVVRDDRDGGGFVSKGPWTHATTSIAGTDDGVLGASLSGLPLVDDHRYHFAVRALKNGQRSPDAVSTGVRVHLHGGGSAPVIPDDLFLTGRSCVYFCSAGRSADGRGAGWFAALFLIYYFRKSSHRTKTCSRIVWRRRRLVGHQPTVRGRPRCVAADAGELAPPPNRTSARALGSLFGLRAMPALSLGLRRRRGRGRVRRP